MKTIYFIPLSVILLMVFMIMPAFAEFDEELDETGDYISWDEESYADSDISRSADSLINPNFGVASGEISVTYSGSCTPIRSSYTYDQNVGWRYSTTGGSSWFDCSANIPQGAKMLRMGIEVYDNDASADVYFAFIRGPFLSDNVYSDNTSSGASTARQYLLVQLTAENITINYESNIYGGRVGLRGDSLTQFRSVDFQYQLQISPAPATATFNDVPTSHTFFKEVEALVASGITGGCGGSNYCPDNNVTRGQMAAFLARALGLHFWQ